MARLATALILAAIGLTSAAADQWIRYKKSEYLFVNQKSTWRDAQRFCYNKGANLATFEDANENAYIVKEVKRQFPSENDMYNLWMGLDDQDDEGKFVNIRGVSPSFQAWRSGQPDNANNYEDCVQLDVRDGTWNDYPCFSRLSFICEKTGCTSQPADVVFVLDSSGSVGPVNFRKQLEFVKSMVEQFEIGIDKTRIGVITFRNWPNAEFHLNKYWTRTEITKAIDSISYRDGATNTGAALHYMREQSFAVLNGARKNVVKIGIVLTDGRSTIPYETEKHARLAQNAGINMFAIGIGSEINRRELQFIASGDGDQNVFEVDGFDALQGIKSILASKACNAPVKPPTAAPPPQPTRRTTRTTRATTKQAPTLVPKPTTPAPWVTKKPFKVVPISDKSDNRGKKFIFGFAENFAGGDGSEVMVVNLEKTPVRVTVYSPKYKSPQLLESFTLEAGAWQTVDVHSKLRQYGTGLEHKAVVVESSGEVAVFGANKEHNSGDGFMAIPIDMLGSEYRVATWTPSSVDMSQITIAGAYDNTRVRVTLRGLKPGEYVEYGGKRYFNNQVITFKFDEYDSFQIQSTGDLTGTYITADKPVAVLSANKYAKVGPGSANDRDHIVEMIPPLSKWGSTFVTHPTFVKNTYKIVASKDNTEIEFNHGLGRVKLAKAGDFHEIEIPSNKAVMIQSTEPTMVTQFVKSPETPLEKQIPSMTVLTPVRQFNNHYTFAVPKGIAGPYTNYLSIVIRKSDRDRLVLDGKPISSVPIKWTEVPGSQFMTASLPITYGSHVLYHENPTVNFGAYVSGIAGRESYGYPVGSRLSDLSGVCRKTKVVVNDGIDNDCDGRVDEELVNNIDDDGDGLVDEDTAKGISTSGPPIPNPGCDMEAEIMFLVDSTVGEDNFKTQMSFVSEVVRGYRVASNKVRVGVIRYSRVPDVLLNIDDLTGKSSVLKAISNVQYNNKGGTNTAYALRVAREQFLAKARPGVKKIAVVLTDGQSMNTDATKIEAELAKKAGMSVFAVGVGDRVNREELKSIASDPDSEHVFSATNFNALQGIEDQLTKATCDAKLPTISPPLPKVSTCKAQADIMFVLDASGSVGPENFAKQLDFVKGIANSFDIAPDKTRVGIVTYDYYVNPQFELKTHSTKADLMAAIDKIKFTGYTTETGAALKHMRTNSFTTANGDRPGVPNIGIVITDGKSTNRQETLKEAQEAIDAGIKMFAIGVGQGADVTELKAMASDPNNKYMFEVDNYESLKNIQKTFSQTACEVTTSIVSPPRPTAAPGCNARADIAFILDSSGSVGPESFSKMLDFVQEIVGAFEIGADKVQVGVVRYNNAPYLQFYLDKYSDKSNLLTAIDNVRYTGGGTSTGEAIKYTREKVFAKGNGNRDNVIDLALVITDGTSQNVGLSKSEAQLAKNAGIEMFAVGVGGGVNMVELNAIGSDPDKDHVFPVSNFDGLSAIKQTLTRKLCDVKFIPTTPKPPTTRLPDPCKDILPNCKDYDKPAACSGPYKGWAEVNCARYCGFCKPLYPETIPPCKDVLSNCADFPYSVCSDSATLKWSKANCRKFCGFCGLTITTGFYGKCHYKGEEYKEGETWQDGCDYTCVCEDGKIGAYRCYSKCPVYYDLPEQCTLVSVPGECCKKPVCDFGSKITTTTGTGSGSVDGVDVCVYKKQNYNQGQTWRDGCDQQCTCLDAKKGYYECQTLCATYSSLPKDCKLRKLPGECCAKPVCEWTTTTGTVTGKGSTTGTSSVVKPTPTPPCADSIDDCDAYSKDVCVGEYRGWAIDNCRKHCGYCDLKPTPGTGDKCIYKGVTYSEGETWRDGCSECVCDDAVVGYYRCSDNCPRYVNLPSQCREVKKGGDCCTTVKCDFGEFVGSKTGTGKIPQIVVEPGTGGVKPTSGTGGGPTPTSTTGTGKPLFEGCVYKGKLYIERQRWQDGCDYTCVCEDGKTGKYRCNSRCPTYGTLPKECKMTENPNDPCCQHPKCEFTGTTGTVTGVKPGTYKPGITGTGTITPGVTPKPGTGPTPTPGQPGKIGFCVYNGNQYKQGDTWRDGCSLDCECVDANIGFYRCTDICPSYTNLPPQCVLVASTTEPCCKEPKCTFNPTTGGFTGRPGPKPTSKTTVRPTPPKPGLEACIYKDQSYREGQEWYDGCKYKCRCEDGSTGYYRCDSRCPEYTNIPPQCKMVADPSDPSCCMKPHCDFKPTTGTITGTGSVIPVIPGTITGTGNNNKPTPTPGTVVNPVLNYCLYKGTKHFQYETWRDGCDYNCECVDASEGRYKCTQRCSVYSDLPPQCKLVQDPKDSCCQIPKCDFKPTTGSITGTGKPGTNVTPTPVVPVKVNYCVYNNVRYTQGQEWSDGCKLRCKCEDASRGYFRCNDRCPTYVNVPAQCTMVTDPKDKCCLIPDCTFTGTTGTITGQVTIPGTGEVVTPPPGKITGTGTVKGTCVYNNNVYKQGDKWQDGCLYNCECVDASTGYYECSERCGRYPNLPAQCKMVQDPMDQCCKKPSCTFLPQTTIKTGVRPTPSKPTPPTPSVCEDKRLDCSLYGTSICSNEYKEWAKDNCADMCGYCTDTGKPSVTPPVTTNKFCIYTDNRQYKQGETWDDGCKYRCKCEDADIGYYVCTDRCRTYNNLPSYCKLVRDPQDSCCTVPDCNFPVVTKSPVTGARTVTPLVGNKVGYCEYKGNKYNQGAKWRDGCLYNCECLDETNGYYQCTDLCPKYNNLPAQCVLETDPSNPCCKKPNCQFVTKTTVITGQVTPSATTRSPVVTSKPVCVDKINSCNVYGKSVCTEYKEWATENCRDYCGLCGDVVKPTALAKFCVYTDNRKFGQDETWEDGCKYRCKCEDADIGYYVCTDRCKTYNNLPSFCQLVPDTADPCCRVPKCDFPSFTQSPVTGSGSGRVTAKPGTKLTYCEYKGTKYSKGVTWKDGCSYNCECIDETTGYYECTDMCPTYNNLPPVCTLVQDPTNPCCKKPSCSFVSKTTVITGQVTPAPPTKPTDCTDKRSDCNQYGGDICYNEYMDWARENCADYCGHCDGTFTPRPNPGTTKSPVASTKSPNPSTGVVPNPSTKKPGCTDKRTDCNQYSREVCYNEYMDWARENCADYCGHCSGTFTKGPVVSPKPGTGIVPNPTTSRPGVSNKPPSRTTRKPGVTVIPGCVDKIPNCHDYSPDVCFNEYSDWAKQNCADFCGHCDGTFTPRPNPGTTKSPVASTKAPNPRSSIAPNPSTKKPDCTDKRTDCHLYGSDICHNEFKDWARENCADYCGHCPGTSTPKPNPGTSKAPVASTKGPNPRSSIAPNPSTKKPDCTDKRTDCLLYGSDICHNEFKDWARENCADYCGHCPGTSTPKPNLGTSKAPVASTKGPVVSPKPGTGIVPNPTTSRPGVSKKPPSRTTRKPGVTVIPGCVDKIPNCHDYSPDVCFNEYSDWAKQNCADFCGHCDGTFTPRPNPGTTKSPVASTKAPNPRSSIAPNPSTKKPDCTDKRTDCHLYGSDICHNGFKDWARENCADYCGHCPGTSTPKPNPGTSKAPVASTKGPNPRSSIAPNPSTKKPDCTDKRTDCHLYGSDICHNEFKNWARENCADYCGHCPGTSTPKPNPGTSKAPVASTKGPVVSPKPGTGIVPNPTTSRPGVSNKPPSRTTRKPGVTVIPGCVDKIPNCHDYSPDVCFNEYMDWAKQNCADFCGHCDGTFTPRPNPGTTKSPVASTKAPNPRSSIAPNPSTKKPDCTDKRTDCHLYGSDICHNEFKDWARVNCADYCGHCPGTSTPKPNPGTSKAPVASTKGPVVSPKPGTGIVPNPTTSRPGVSNKPPSRTTRKPGVTVIPGCVDKIPNCHDYSPDVCFNEYMDWAKQNCADFCGHCDGTFTPRPNPGTTKSPVASTKAPNPRSSIAPNPSTKKPDCTDKRTDCHLYGSDICHNEFKDWARENCADYCGHCPGTSTPKPNPGTSKAPVASTKGPVVSPKPGTGIVPNPTTSRPGVSNKPPSRTTRKPGVTVIPGCVDKIPNCHDYSPDVCFNEYMDWAKQNCADFCGHCDGTFTPRPNPGTTKSPVASTKSPNPSTGVVPNPSTKKPGCTDKRTDCNQYTKEVCYNEYMDWARENCADYCGHCSGTFTKGPVVSPKPATGIVPNPTTSRPGVSNKPPSRTTRKPGVTLIPGCVDKIPNCHNYSPDVCFNEYSDWAKQNCADFCGHCDGTFTPRPNPGTTKSPVASTKAPNPRSSIVPNPSTKKPDCTDKRTDCHLYGSDICHNEFKDWARENCADYCGHCPGTSTPKPNPGTSKAPVASTKGPVISPKPGTGIVPNPTTSRPGVSNKPPSRTTRKPGVTVIPGCVDKIPNCHDYSPDVCFNEYMDWAKQNCADFCGHCDGTFTPRPNPGSTKSPVASTKAPNPRSSIVPNLSTKKPAPAASTKGPVVSPKPGTGIVPNPTTSRPGVSNKPPSRTTRKPGVTVIPGCVDKIPNCHDYSPDVCFNEYMDWAKQNCADFCGHCDGTFTPRPNPGTTKSPVASTKAPNPRSSIVPNPSTKKPDCTDKRTDCHLYGSDICHNEFKDWARENCADYCGHCPGTSTPKPNPGTSKAPVASTKGPVVSPKPGTGIVPNPTTSRPGVSNKPPSRTTRKPGVTVIPGCVDKIPNCHDYSPDVCFNEYMDWAKQNCADFCGHCDGTFTPRPNPGTTKSPVASTKSPNPSTGVVPNPSTKKPGCTDKRTDCNQYTKEVCYNEYMDWARENCADYCGHCSGTFTKGPVVSPKPATGIVPNPTTSRPGVSNKPPSRTTRKPGVTLIPGCVDKIPNCHNYSPDVCFNEYSDWAKQNCADFCGHCDGTFTPRPNPGTTKSPVASTKAPNPRSSIVPNPSTKKPDCTDKRTDCHLYGSDICHNEFKDWARENCADYCGHCPGTSTPKPNPGTSKAPVASTKGPVISPKPGTGIVPNPTTSRPGVSNKPPSRTTRKPGVTVIPGCVDKIPNCLDYSPDVCFNEYMDWAKQNCADFCGHCDGTFTPRPNPGSTKSPVASTKAPNPRSSIVPNLSTKKPAPAASTKGPDVSPKPGTGIVPNPTTSRPGVSNKPPSRTTRKPGVTVIPGCVDKIPNCHDYSPDVCFNEYMDWAKQNCADFCGHCDGTFTPRPNPGTTKSPVASTKAPNPRSSIVPNPSTKKPDCTDKRTDCHLYGGDICHNEFKDWARENCADYCGHCSGTYTPKPNPGTSKAPVGSTKGPVVSPKPGTGIVPNPTTSRPGVSNKPPSRTTRKPGVTVIPGCVDKIPNCHNYSPDVCFNEYRDWAKQNCADFCGHCDGTFTPRPNPGTTNSPVASTKAPNPSTGIVPNPSTKKPDCTDKRTDCHLYGGDICHNEFKDWARENCADYCGHCSGTYTPKPNPGTSKAPVASTKGPVVSPKPGTGIVPNPTTSRPGVSNKPPSRTTRKPGVTVIPGCVDKIPNCHNYSPDVCFNEYRDWAKQNCADFCGHCDGTFTPRPNPGTTNSPVASTKAPNPSTGIVPNPSTKKPDCTDKRTDCHLYGGDICHNEFKDWARENCADYCGHCSGTYTPKPNPGTSKAPVASTKGPVVSPKPGTGIVPNPTTSRPGVSNKPPSRTTRKPGVTVIPGCVDKIPNCHNYSPDVCFNEYRDWAKQNCADFCGHCDGTFTPRPNPGTTNSPVASTKAPNPSTGIVPNLSTKKPDCTDKRTDCHLYGGDICHNEFKDWARENCADYCGHCSGTYTPKPNPGTSKAPVASTKGPVVSPKPGTGIVPNPTTSRPGVSNKPPSRTTRKPGVTVIPGCVDKIPNCHNYSPDVCFNEYRDWAKQNCADFCGHCDGTFTPRPNPGTTNSPVASTKAPNPSTGIVPNLSTKKPDCTDKRTDCHLYGGDICHNEFKDWARENCADYCGHCSGTYTPKPNPGTSKAPVASTKGPVVSPKPGTGIVPNPTTSRPGVSNKPPSRTTRKPGVTVIPGCVDKIPNCHNYSPDVCFNEYRDWAKQNCADFCGHCDGTFTPRPNPGTTNSPVASTKAPNPSTGIVPNPSTKKPDCTDKRTDCHLYGGDICHNEFKDWARENCADYCGHCSGTYTPKPNPGTSKAPVASTKGPVVSPKPGTGIVPNPTTSRPGVSNKPPSRTTRKPGVTVIPGCVDKIPNCHNYSPDVCFNEYRDWAKQNCADFCGHCDGTFTPRPNPGTTNSPVASTKAPNPSTGIVPNPSTKKPDCTDKRTDCHLYGGDICHNEFKDWARENCADYCGHCSGTYTPKPNPGTSKAPVASTKGPVVSPKPGTGIVPNPTTSRPGVSNNPPSRTTRKPGVTVIPGCVDKIPNCHNYSPDVCFNEYRDWAKQNCADFCGHCDGTFTPRPNPGTTNSPVASTKAPNPSTGIVPNPSTKKPDCTDKRTDCHLYGGDICHNEFKDWARENCADYCGHCSGTYTPKPNPGTSKAPVASTKGPVVSPKPGTGIVPNPTTSRPGVSNKPPSRTTRKPGVTVIPGCVDKIPNCHNYSPDVCFNEYRDWAKQNCADFCGHCDGTFTPRPNPGTTNSPVASTKAPNPSTGIVPNPSTKKPDCTDKRTDCHLYGGDICHNEFKDWARENCADYCGHCSGTYTPKPNPGTSKAPVASTKGPVVSPKPGTGIVPNPTTSRPGVSNKPPSRTTRKPGVTVIPGCVDKIPNCHDYSPDVCFNEYSDWAKQNCADFCGHCDGTFTPRPNPGTTKSPVASTKAPNPSTGIVPNPSTKKPGCADKRSDCSLYSSDICYNEYSDWARENCADFCGHCSGTFTLRPNPGSTKSPVASTKSPNPSTSIVPNPSTKKPGCTDKRTDCNQYSKDICYNEYMDWARENCADYCGHCSGAFTLKPNPGSSIAPVASTRAPNPSTGIVPNPSTMKPDCTDKRTDCQLYSRDICHNEFKDWARENCADYCGHCGRTITPKPSPGTSKAPVASTKAPVVTRCADKRDDCKSYSKAICTNEYRAWAQDNCADFCGFCTPVTTKPGISNVCVYNNKQYKQGESWTDGCSLVCECIDANYGIYRCDDRCTIYTNLPSSCQLVTDPKDSCCKVPQCSPITISVTPKPGKPSTTIVVPTGVIGTITGKGTVPVTGTGGVITGSRNICVYTDGKPYGQGAKWQDGCKYDCECVDSLRGLYQCAERCPRYTNLPSYCKLVKRPGECCEELQCSGVVIPTGTGVITGGRTPLPPSPTPVIVKPNKCVYKGVEYKQGDTWSDGCLYRCECVDGSTGYWRCNDRCPKYNNLPAGCSLHTDPQDSCCKIPKCAPVTVTPKPGTGTGITVVVPVGIKETITGIGKVPPGTVVTGTRDLCVYKGNLYKQGDKWSDGCSYNCECLNGVKGEYRCTAICPTYSNLPSQCRMQKKPGQCCDDLVCNGQVVTPTGTGTGGIVIKPTSTTVIGQNNFCVYKGTNYKQGEKWSDGCSYRCECVDAVRGMWSCNDRCPMYTNIPSQCTLQTDPLDSCCKIPKCNGVTVVKPGTTSTIVVPTGTTGTFTGKGTMTNVIGTGGGTVTGTGSVKNKCVYKGSLYNQGDRWEDGCDYSCECVDAAKGTYRCREKCPTFTNIPSYCKRVPERNECCDRLDCDGYIIDPNTKPGITGVTDKCVYNSKVYIEGQSWEDGCKLRCECLDGNTGFYRCQNICPIYSEIPSYCTLRTLPGKCCAEPVCTTGPDGKAVVVVGTYPGAITGFRTGVVPGSLTGGTSNKGTVPGGGPVTGTSGTVITGGRNMCLYKGKSYSQGQRWMDGCNYDCECTDAAQGMYRCSEICPRYSRVPSQCKLVDVKGACCKELSCKDTVNVVGVTGITVTATGPGGGITLGKCEDKLDNCDAFGDDACSDKFLGWAKKNCAKHCNLCHLLITTPAPPTGCVDKLDNCDAFGDYACEGDFKPWASVNCAAYCRLCPGGTDGNYLKNTGSGTVKTSIGTGTVEGVGIGCSYHGKTYQQGQTWNDGCTFRCTCLNANSGQYTCDAMCPTWTLPLSCRFNAPAAGKCCPKPVCPAEVVITYPKGYTEN